jgi:hypothetical protein
MKLPPSQHHMVAPLIRHAGGGRHPGREGMDTGFADMTEVAQIAPALVFSKECFMSWRTPRENENEGGVTKDTKVSET